MRFNRLKDNSNCRYFAIQNLNGKFSFVEIFSVCRFFQLPHGKLDQLTNHNLRFGNISSGKIRKFEPLLGCNLGNIILAIVLTISIIIITKPLLEWVHCKICYTKWKPSLAVFYLTVLSRK